MDKLKQWVALTVVGCLAIVAGGWFLLVSPKRQHATELRQAAAVQVDANNALETQLVQLKAQARDLPKEQAKLAAVAARIPDSRAMPALIRALNKAAKSSGVELVSVSPSSTTLVAAAASLAAAPLAVPAAAPPARPAAAPPAGTSGAAVAAPAAAAASSSAAGQLASIGVTLNVVGGFFQIEQFVSALESLQRSMRLTNVSLAPGVSPVRPVTSTASGPVDDGKSLTATLLGQVYTAVNRPPATAVVVPNAAAAK